MCTCSSLLGRGDREIVADYRLMHGIGSADAMLDARRRRLRNADPSFPSSAMRSYLLAACAALSTVTAGCATAPQGAWVELAGTRYAVEVADDDAERARGLMFRDSLGIEQGMLFIHERAEMQAYWMKNTRIPLDILYFDDARRLVSQQRDVPPCTLGDACPPYPSAAPARFVLELNAGEARKLGLEDGAELTFGPGIQVP